LHLATRRAQEYYVSPAADYGYGHGHGADRGGSSLGPVLWRRKWSILLCTAVSVAVGLVYLQRSIPIFQSTVTISVEQSMPKVFGDAMSRAASSSGYLFTQCELIRSTAILNQALSMPGVLQTKALRNHPAPVEVLKGIVSPEPGRQGGLLNISVSSPDPEDAATIANGVSRAYLDYQASQHKQGAIETMKVLQNMMRHHMEDLTEVRTKTTEFLRDNPDLAIRADPGESSPLATSAIATALAEQRLKTLELRMLLEEARGANNDPVLLMRALQRVASRYSDAYLSTFMSPRLLEEFSNANQRLQEVREVEGTIGRNQEAKRRVEVLGRQLLAAAQSVQAALEKELAISLDREEKYRSELTAQHNEGFKTTIKSVEYNELTAQADRIERAIDALDSRIREVNLSEDAGALSAAVLEVAKPSYGPISPKQFQTMGFAGMVGLMFGLGVALLRDATDSRLRSAEDMSSLLSLPILGTVPQINAKRVPSVMGRQMELQPGSPTAEAYRTIRTSIDFGQFGRPARTMLFTSPSAGDGKSTCCSNLAIAMASAGRRVLLIDADCRRPTQHKVFGLDMKIGLTDILNKKATLDEAVQATTVDNLSVLPCGTIPGNPSELLNGNAFLDLLTTAGTRYDLVMIDSPPLGPVTDARVLAGRCDVTVLVMRAGVATRAMAEHARDALDTVNAQTLGLIVNGTSYRRAGYSNRAYHNHSRRLRRQHMEHADPDARESGRAEPARLATDVDPRGRRRGSRPIAKNPARPPVSDEGPADE
jgi:polysaccharide biosynthesis transport protein